MRQFNDIMRIDVIDTYYNLSMKTLTYFATIPHKVDADFYFKIDDDIGVNVDALGRYLAKKRTQGNLYLVRGGRVTGGWSNRDWRFRSSCFVDTCLALQLPFSFPFSCFIMPL